MSTHYETSKAPARPDHECRHVRPRRGGSRSVGERIFWQDSQERLQPRLCQLRETIELGCKGEPGSLFPGAAAKRSEHWVPVEGQRVFRLLPSLAGWLASGLALLFCLALVDPLVGAAETIDRLVAVVNRQIVTLGDVEQEMRLQELDALAGDFVGPVPARREGTTQNLIVQRLIEQNLIREQIQQFPGLEVSDAQVESQFASIEQKVGGTQKLAETKIDLRALRARLRWQLQVMKFIDYRFRQFVVVDAKEIEAYYQTQLVPELQRRNTGPPPELDAVEEGIRKILTEEKVNTQVDEWLASLRRDATIEVFH
ncbi:MAG: hypothetical protein FJW26_10290 [Acidimicrobiia bacterium]|nr:hypothetical protein [Acidimicrobiia bacterium]